MLKEIKINQFVKTDGEPIYLLDIESGSVVTLEDVFQNIRILKDVNLVRADPVIETPEAKKTIDSQTTDSGKRKRRKSDEIQSAVIKAYDCGNRNIAQVMEIAKVDYKTARKYLPISKEG